MNVLKSWAVSVCGACFTSAVISFLMPSMKFERVLKIGLCAFMIIALITPFTGSEKIDISSFFTDKTVSEGLAKQGEDLFTKTTLNTAAENVKKTIFEALSNKGFSVENITVSMHIDKENNISINEISVEGVKEKDRQKVHDYLKKTMNLEVTVR